ncbi:hypothetical protein B0O99DRAFT_718352 [Bisporella sp. PMI_857]|nr:hypothetical protein B0O99DRAFT_718352 [Bisporella sp. PMI_857]
MGAAENFHAWMKEHAIPSAAYTKVAAFATPLYTDLFVDLEKTGHPLGKHLRMVQVEQDLTFYIAACEKDLKKRFADYMDQEWFLKSKTSWFDNLDLDGPLYLPPDHPLYHAPCAPFPELRAVIPYLNKVVIYDALAALGTAGADILDELQVLTDGDSQMHCIVGRAGPPPDTGIHPTRMATALSALLKGSLLHSQSRRKSSVETGS